MKYTSKRVLQAILAKENLRLRQPASAAEREAYKSYYLWDLKKHRVVATDVDWKALLAEKLAK